MSEQVVEKRTLTNILLSGGMKKQLEAALPRHITADRLARVVVTELRKNPRLQQCDQTSFFGALMVCAQLGLEPCGALGHAYLIPYGKEVQLIIGYKGMIDLTRRSGQVISLSVRAVCENDEFSYSFGLNESLTHTPASGDRGALTHVYAVAKLKDGGIQFDVLSRTEIEKIRNQSKAGKFGPWVTHFEEMAKKTVIRRLFKYLPVSIEMQRAIALDEGTDVGLKASDFIEGEFCAVNEDPPLTEPVNVETEKELEDGVSE
jgi:recombination protein RecT